MTWAILILIFAVILYLVGTELIKQDIISKLLKITSVVLIAGSISRLWTPYYLVKVNPSLLKEMVVAMQDAEQENKSREIRSYIKENKNNLIKDAVVLGNEKSDKTIFLFSDYSCPYCRRVHAELKKVIEQDKDVRVVVKQFSIHGPLSDAPAKAVIAAKLQGNDKAVKLDSALMEKEYFTNADLKDRSKIDSKIQANVIKIAKKIGLDTKQLLKDMEGEVVMRELGQVRELSGRFQISGTPFLIVGDQAFPGAISASQIINALK